jgi:hypothetical protein
MGFVLMRGGMIRMIHAGHVGLLGVEEDGQKREREKDCGEGAVHGDYSPVAGMVGGRHGNRAAWRQGSGVKSDAKFEERW